MRRKFYLSLICTLVAFNMTYAQSWAEKMQSPNGNFYVIKSEFEQYWLTHDRLEKGVGYKAFKRWENFVERRVYPSGNLSLLNLTPLNYQAFLKQEESNTQGGTKGLGNGSNQIASATFTAMGPFGAINGNAGGQFLKSGRLNFVTIDPTNSSNLWVGAPAGGLWKSTNGGTSWTTGTDQLAVIGCTDLAIDPTNTSIMYLATGDGNAGDTRSIGVLKSSNGGGSWAATGLTFSVNSGYLIRRLLINPSNTQILLAATNAGIYRTTNGGTSWSQVSTFSCYDLEFKPGDPNTVYAGGTTFYLSTNGGANFIQITSGIAVSGVNRMAIAVTPDDVNYVYVLASLSSNSGFQGLYRSTTSGTSFSVMSTSPNILNWSNTGSGTGGQGWYDLCIAASPNNKLEIVTGGVNVWKSTNGGSSWTIYGHWTGSGAPFTHADHHDLEYDASGVLYNANDGTIYKRAATSNSWTEISGSMNISQIYKIGLSGQTANKWITGHQDNGTSIYNGTTYDAKLGGDGMDCFYDRTNDNNVFGEYQGGAMQRSTNGGTNWSSATSGMSGTAPWVTPWKQDPQVSNNLYAGYSELFKSTNLGASWTQLSAIGGSGTIREFAVSPNNSLVIYVLKSSGIYKTTNGGTSWTNVTGTVPVGSALPEFISIKPSDANTAWVVLSGYSSGNKVFMTTNGGSSWTNISSNLPNIPANCCVYEPNSSDRIYVGMDVGIFYKDNASTNWTLYNTGLPNVPISDLEISPANPTLLYAATYGRGVWAASLYPFSLIPASSFTANPAVKCSGATITFSDQSTNTPTAWNWGVIPNTGVSISSPTVQNPSMIFSSAGTYTVNFQSVNANGPGTTTSQIFTVVGSPTLLVSNSSQTLCGSGSVTYTASGATTYSWSDGGGSGSSAIFSPTSSAVYTVTGISNACVSKKTVSVVTAPAASISISGLNSICIGNNVTLLANGASSYTWNNSIVGPFLSVSPSVTTTYSVIGITASNCTPTANMIVTVNPDPLIGINLSDSLICVNQAVVLNATGASVYTWMPGGQTGSSISYTPSSTQSYTCYGKNVNGCSGQSAKTVSVSICEGINTFVLNETQFNLYPNPTKGKLSLKSSFVSNQAVRIVLTDISGKVLFEQEHVFSGEEASFDFDISGLASGSYIMRLSLNNERSNSIKIIKD